MKKALLKMALLVSLAIATKPDFTNLLYKGINLDASSTEIHRDGKLSEKLKLVFTNENLPDTIYSTFYIHNNSGETVDSIVQYETYSYDFDANNYTKKFYDVNREELTPVFTTITTYDDQGLLIVDSTYYENDLEGIILTEYTYNNANLLAKCTYWTDCEGIRIPDSICWTYNENNQVATSTFHNKPENTDKFNPLTVVSEYFYKDNKVIEIVTKEIDSEGEELGTTRITYNLKESPVVETSMQTNQFELSLTEGRILHLTNPQKAMVRLYSPSGRELKKLSLTANGHIKEWNSLSNGYYVLRVKQGAQTATLSFIK